MTAKKAKGLADELLDDLLEGVDRQTHSKQEPPSTEKIRSESLGGGSSKSSKSKFADFSFGTVNDKKVENESTIPLGTKTEPMTSLPVYEPPVPEKIVKPSAAGGLVGLTEKALAQSESLRIAQQRILDLEKLIEELRDENEKLMAAGDTIKKRSDEMKAENEKLSNKLKDIEDRYKDENAYLAEALTNKNDEQKNLKTKIEEMEGRVQATVQKVRTRERELENRLELLKVENSALVNNKNNMILDLKRNIDQMTSELEGFRNRSQQMNKQLDDNRETLRRTVKALRLALNMLDGGIDKASGNKGES